MCIKALKCSYLGQVFLGIFFCLIGAFVWAHPQEFLSASSFSEDKLLKPSSEGYGSCQKPTEFGSELNSTPLKEACKPPLMMHQGPELFIFISNSMPEQSLKQWAIQSEKAGGSLVLRGFIEDSPKKTLEWVVTVFGESTHGVTVDPERFAEFNIDKVPAVVISLPFDKTSEAAEIQNPLFEVVYGNVPLEQALNVLSQKGSREVREASNRFLARLRGGLE